MRIRPVSAVLVVGICVVMPLLACTWDYPIWSKSPRSDTPLFRFTVRSGSGYIDRTGKVVIPPRFTFFGNDGGEFRDGLARVYSQEGGAFFINAEGQKTLDVTDGEFSEGLAAVRFGSRWGYIERDGKTAVRGPFDSAGLFSEGLAAVRVGGNSGYIDRTGRFVIPPQFAWADDFHEGYAVVVERGRCLFIGYGPCAGANRSVLPGPTEGRGSASRCLYSLINRTGNVVVPAKYPDMKDFSEGLVPVGDGKKWGYVDATGRVQIPLQFEKAESFSEGLAAVQRDGKWGFVDKAGAMVIPPQFTHAFAFSEGLSVVAFTYGHDFFIDKQGRHAVPGTFTAASSFVMGLAHVRKGADWERAEWSYIDKRGKSVFRYRETDSR